MSLVGCAEALPPDAICETPAEVHVTLSSGSLLNPDESGIALPTEIRVLALRDATLFENGTFDDAWAPAAPLAEAILASQSVTLYPGETAELAIAPTAETTALVGIAIVRRPAGRTWRVIVPIEALPCGASAQLPLHVDEYRIERATESR
jgi:type VI secretion system protein VasD